MTIYTDGGCHGNPGPGAWAWRGIDETNDVVGEASGFAARTTNNRMELQAVIEALRWVETLPTNDVRVITDSQYVRQGITSWIKNWKSNGWLTAAKKPVKNVDLWTVLSELDAAVGPAWAWVKGHAGDEHNEACDRAVQRAIQEAS